MRRAPLLFFLFLISLPLSAQQLKIYHIDVEQASSTLFVAPGGKTLLVDSGKNGMGSRIKSVMDRAHVNKIDLFVATHYHEDHYGGIDDLIELGFFRWGFIHGQTNEDNAMSSWASLAATAWENLSKLRRGWQKTRLEDEDIRLGDAAVELGYKLNTGVIKVNDVAKEIRTTICK